MSQELESYLQLALKRLDNAYVELLRTQGFTPETEKLRMLIELAKEQLPVQVPNENSRPSPR